MSKCRMWRTMAWRNWRSGSSAMKPKCRHTKNFPNDWCNTNTGIKNHALWWFLFESPPKGTIPFIWRSYQPCTICEGLQMWPQILPNFLVTNEAPFTGDAITNTRNLYSFAQENPQQETQCHFQHFSVNMLCGVLGTNLIGPCIIKLHVTALYYWDCLENELSWRLRKRKASVSTGHKRSRHLWQKRTGIHALPTPNGTTASMHTVWWWTFCNNFET